MSPDHDAEPWRVRELRNGERPLPTPSFEDQAILLESMPDGGKPEQDARCIAVFGAINARNVANAKLAAAAPDLLAALEKLLAADVVDDERTRQAMGTARKAIAKAKGA